MTTYNMARITVICGVIMLFAGQAAHLLVLEIVAAIMIVIGLAYVIMIRVRDDISG